MVWWNGAGSEVFVLACNIRSRGRDIPEIFGPHLQYSVPHDQYFLYFLPTVLDIFRKNFTFAFDIDPSLKWKGTIQCLHGP